MANNPPSYMPEAIPTALGWAHPLTGERLDVTSGLENPVDYYKPNSSRFAFIDHRAGSLKSIEVGDAGESYTTPPTVTITGGGGVGATAKAIVGDSGEIISYVIGNPGARYASAPTVTLTAVGSGATATAKVEDGIVTELEVGNAGTGYTQPPRVTITGDGEGATAVAVLGSGDDVGKVVGYVVTNSGFGYTEAPTVVVSSGSGATATAIIEDGDQSVDYLLNHTVHETVANFALFLFNGYEDIESITFDPKDGSDPLDLGSSTRFSFNYQADGTYKPELTVTFKSGSILEEVLGESISVVSSDVVIGGSVEPEPEPVPPSIATGPTITGTPEVAQILEVEHTWNGDGEIAFTYQWQTRADAEAEWVDGSTDDTFLVQEGHAGHQVQVIVTATSEHGTATATSAVVTIEA